MNDKSRLHYFDIAKGILILLLLVDHFGVVCENVGKDIHQENFAWIYAFIPLFTTSYMQCFFFISGYCSNFDIDDKTFLLKQLKGLVLPAITFGVVLGFWGGYFCWNLNRFTFVSLWFLYALFFSKIVCFYLNKYVSDYRINLAITISLLIAATVFNHYFGNFNPLYIIQGLSACFFVMLGIILRKKNETYECFLKYSWLIFLLVFGMVYCLHIQFSLPSVTGVLKQFEICNVPLLIFIPIIGTFTLLRLCKVINKCRFLEYYGKHSLVVYCIHMIPFYYIIKYMLVWFNPVNRLQGTVFYLSSLVAEITVLYFLFFVFNKKPFRYLLGKF